MKMMLFDGAEGWRYGGWLWVRGDARSNQTAYL